MQEIVVYILLLITVAYTAYKIYTKVIPKDNNSICGTCSGCDAKKSCALHQNLEKSK